MNNIELLKEVNKFTGFNIKSFKDVTMLEKETDYFWNKHPGDLSKYESFHYLYIALNCYKKYSRNSVKRLSEALPKKEIKSILDFGAGLGLTSLQLAEEYPNAKVSYYNYPGSLQDRFFLSIKDDKVEYLKKLTGEYDVIFCSELFEHIEKPIDLLKKLMLRCKKYFCVSNAFGTKSYGHYDAYIVDDHVVKPRKTSKIFNETMREQFKDSKIRSWNGRPRLFKRI